MVCFVYNRTKICEGDKYRIYTDSYGKRYWWTRGDQVYAPYLDWTGDPMKDAFTLTFPPIKTRPGIYLEMRPPTAQTAADYIFSVKSAGEEGFYLSPVENPNDRSPVIMYATNLTDTGYAGNPFTQTAKPVYFQFEYGYPVLFNIRACTQGKVQLRVSKTLDDPLTIACFDTNGFYNFNNDPATFENPGLLLKYRSYRQCLTTITPQVALGRINASYWVMEKVV